MSDISTNEGPTVNICERPFTARDLVRHSMWTWVPAMIAAVVMLLTSGGLATGLYIAVMIGVILLGLVWLGAPLALVLGRALRTVRPVAVHLLAFAALGYVASSLLILIASAVWIQGAADLANPNAIALSLGCAGCVVIGRSAALLLRRRDDRPAAMTTPPVAPAAP